VSVRWLPLAVAVAVGCGSAESTPRTAGPPPAVVEAVAVAPGTLRDEIDVLGQLEADESVLVRPEIDGVVAAIAFDEGQEVAAGALLVRLRDEEQRARLAEAEAERILSQRAHERAQQLAGEGVLSAAELDRMVAERDAARARIERTRVDVERTEIRAPFAGVLGRRLVSPGDRVTRETALVQLDATERLKLVFTVPEVLVPAVHPGMPLTVTVAPWPGEEFPGAVYFVAPSLDPQNRRLLLKAHVPNPARRLRPGLFATARVEIARRDDVLVVPESALVHEAQGTYVWRVAADGTAERTTVEPGLRRAGRVEISSGLAAGDRVVTAGTNKLAPGTPLSIATGSGPRP
jgi:membrane fusion protein (multidrug efflux system)